MLLIRNGNYTNSI